MSETQVTFEAALASDRRKNPTKRKYRLLTLEEHKALKAGEHVLFIQLDNRIGQLTVNGAPKTWKTRPGDVEVPLKYGLYQYTKAMFRNGNQIRSFEILVKEVDQE